MTNVVEILVKGINESGPAMAEAKAESREAAAGADELAAAQGRAAAKTEESGGAMASAGSKMKMAFLGVAVGMGLAVKGAADFQQQTTRLVTSAGESAKNLGMVQSGILSLSASTNTSTEQLSSGMYQIESAGFHAADGLAVLKAAAQGAQAEGADLGEVANAVTSGLNAYGLKAKDATRFTDEMVQTVARGKMTMQDLAGALSAVLPIAAASKISYAQVGGALATMTSMGVSARQGTQDLAATIRTLANPTGVAVTEMSRLGLSSVGISRNLGKAGLTGTIQQLSDAVTSHMGQAGVLITSTMNQSRTAAADAQMMLASLPASIRGVAQAYLNGSITTKQWTTDLKAMPPLTANLAKEFANTANRAHGFNDLLRSGNPVAQTYAAAMSKMLGGATGLNVALMLTGSHAKTFADNVSAISGAAQSAGSDVAGWNVIQQETNFQLGSAEKAVKAMGISLGSALLPAVNAVLHPITDLLGMIAGNRAAADAFAVVVGGVLAGAIGVKMAGALKNMAAGIKAAGDGAQWLIGKLVAQTAATEEAAVAQGEMDVAMDANPIGAIIIAIVALIAVVVELVKHWHAVARAFDVVRHAIASGVDWVISFVKSHWPLLLAILTGPIGLAVYAIREHFGQIVHGAQALNRDVTGFFRSLPGRILHALGDLGSLLYSAGKAVVEGLIHGVEDMAGSAVSTVENIGSSMLHGAMSVLGISSPSREMAKIGAYITQGLILGLQAGIPQAARMGGDLAAAVKTAISGGLVSTAKGDALTAYVQEGNDRLQSLAAQRKAVLGQISAARNFAAQTASSAAGNYALSGFATSGANGGLATVGGIIKGLGLDVGAIRKFTANIKKLAKEGLNRNYLNQLIQMGPDQGGALAEELAKAGLGQIREINSEEYQISKASGQLGKTAANEMFDTGKNAGKGFLSGLESQQKQIAALMAKIAKSMIETLKKELGISSPSTVLRWHGQMAGEGFGLGIEDRLQRVSSASQRLAQAAVPRQGGYGAYGGGRQQLDVTARWEKSGDPLIDEIIKQVRLYVRIRGGSAQQVLGQGAG